MKGLTRSTFANYYQYVLLRLELPLVTARDGESWYDHFLRLQAEATTSDSRVDLRYRVVPTVVNAANYGVPQHRHRVFIVGFRNDVNAEWSFPTETHSKDSLLHSQWVSGEYWDNHKVPKPQRPEPSTGPRLQRLLSTSNSREYAPWRTVRDALVGLPEPKLNGSKDFKNHVFQPVPDSTRGTLSTRRATAIRPECLSTRW